MDGLPPDVRSLWYQMTNQEEGLRRKRQWLMGFPEPESSCRKRSKSDNASTLPETMLREDDLFYEHLKKHVESGFGAHRESMLPSADENLTSFSQQDILRMTLASLDDFTNNGLYLLAKVIGGRSIEVEKSRRKLKKFIKENIGVLGKACSDGDEVVTHRKISRILKDPHNFRKNHAIFSAGVVKQTIRPTVQSHYHATMAILKELRGMSVQTVSAMYKRLKGIQVGSPILSPPRSGWTKARLIERVKSLSLKMISQLNELNELPEPLIKAMSVASLSLKLVDIQNTSLCNFCHYTPEVESLQNQIVRAVNLLSCRVGVRELKCLRKLLAPESEHQLRNGGLRKAIKKMLIEFLFDCSDMDEIPSVLIDVLDVINSCALPQQEVMEEVEGILNLSAQAKQLAWDFLCVSKLDLEYADAYMEDLEDSDGGELFDDHDEEEHLVKADLDDTSEVGSTGDRDDIDSSLLYCTPTWTVNSGRSTVKSESRLKAEIKAEPDEFLFTPSFGDSKSYNNTVSIDTKIHQTTRTARTGDINNSISRFPLYSCSADQTVRKRNFEGSCKHEYANPAEGYESNYSCGMTRDVSKKLCGSRNKYLAIQEVCDEASLIAYRLIGRVMEGYASSGELNLDQSQLSYLNGGCMTPMNPQDNPIQEQATPNEDVDGSIIMQAVRQVVPSFSHSELEKVRKLL